MTKQRARKVYYEAIAPAKKAKRRHNEQIVDHTPKTPYTSPLQRFMQNNCEACDWHKGKCRLEDLNGLTRMKLCIMLYVHESASQGIDLFAKGLVKTAQISETTLEEKEDYSDEEEKEDYSDEELRNADA
jgi:hypothetical protein